MTADDYLRGILARERVGNTLLTGSPVPQVERVVLPIIQAWAGKYLVSVEPSGSIAKGTAVRSGTDVDLFISLSSTTADTLKAVHQTLAAALRGVGYVPRLQNVSLGIDVGGHQVDLVPGKRQDQYSNDHSIYRRRADTWTKTNVRTHINQVSLSGRIQEIMILKVWRNQQRLAFPSFLLELVTIRACHGRRVGDLATNVWTTFEYIRDNIETALFLDPANTNNRISDDMTAAEKIALRQAAARALQAKVWGDIVA